MKNKSMFLQSLDIKILEGNVDIIKVKTGINGQMTNSGVSHFSSITARVYNKQSMLSRCELDDNTINIATECQVSQGKLQKKDFALERRSIYGIYIIQPNKDGKMSLEKYTYVYHNEDGIQTDDSR